MKTEDGEGENDGVFIGKGESEERKGDATHGTNPEKR